MSIDSGFRPNASLPAAESRTLPRVGLSTNPAFFKWALAQPTRLLKTLDWPLGSISKRSSSVSENRLASSSTISRIDRSWPSDSTSRKGSITVWKSGTGMVGSLVQCWFKFAVSIWLAAIALALSAILSKSTSLHITTSRAHERQILQGLLPGSESNRVVKEQRLLTKESESSKALLPGCEPNLHGCSRTLRATGSELRVTRRDPNRRKPAKTGLEMQKAESIHSRRRALTRLSAEIPQIEKAPRAEPSS
jgi:hypothetical protein